jgi:predicted DNA binding protein
MARKKKAENGEAKAPRKASKGGKSRGKRKLTDAQVLAIVAAYQAGGITMTALAAEYGVSAPTVSSIVNGRTYVWLTRIGLEALAEAA